MAVIPREATGTIVFVDVESFSRRSTIDQGRLVTGMSGTVRLAVAPRFRLHRSVHETVILPTGDGVAVAFLHDPRQHWAVSNVVSLIQALANWAKDPGDGLPSVNCRIGINVGPVLIVADANGNKNVCGNTVNVAQRVMDAANPGQVLMTSDCRNHYFGDSLETSYQDPAESAVRVWCHGPYQIHAKHNLQLTVFSLTLNSAQADPPPASKNELIVTVTPLPKEIKGLFAERIVGATNIAFVQLTGFRFLEAFKDRQLSLSLASFRVLMPDPSIFSAGFDSHMETNCAKIEDSVERWRAYFGRLSKRHPHAIFKIGLYAAPPFFGASYIDWNRPGGEISVSPFIWNTMVSACPAFELRWSSSSPPMFYETYVRGLDYIDTQTSNLFVSQR